MNDPILREIRETRDAFSEQHHGDITAMLADLHDSQIRSGRETVRFPPRTCSPVVTSSLSKRAIQMDIESDYLCDEIVVSAAPKQAS